MLNATPEQSDAIAAIITANPGRVLERIETTNIPGTLYLVYDGSAYLIGRDGHVLS